jgi:hypothetical protein
MTDSVGKSDTTDRVITEEWEKNCSCKATSSTYQLRYFYQFTDKGVNTKTVFYPWLSCDKCGRPWIRVHR